MKKIFINIFFVFIVIYSTDLYSYNNNFPSADDNGIYLFLVKGDHFVTRAAKLLGYPGTYWHIEVLFKGYSYGCRNPECSRITYDELRNKLPGQKADIRTMPIQGDVTKAIKYFYNSISEKPYDLFSTNCTWAIWELSKAYGVTKPLLNWVNVQEALKLPIVQQFIREEKIPVPNNLDKILFPDEFIKITTEYASDVVM